MPGFELEVPSGSGTIQPTVVRRVPAPSGGDDSAAITATIAEAVAACQADGTYLCKVVFGPYEYIASRALQQGGANKANSQIPLPYIGEPPPGANQKVTLILEGPQPRRWPMYGQTPVQTLVGGIRSTLTGQAYSATYGIGSIIGGPTVEQVLDARAFSNLMVVWRNLQLRGPDNPSLAGADFSMVAEVDIDQLGVDTNVAMGRAMANGDLMSAVSEPTTPQAIGLIMPKDGNNTIQRVTNYSCLGHYGGLAMQEHTDADNVNIFSCKVAFPLIWSAGAHTERVGMASVEWCPYVVSGVDPATGIDSVPGVYVLHMEALDIEDSDHVSWRTLVEHVHDPTNVLRGTLAYNRTKEGGTANPELVVNGGLKLNLYTERAVGRAPRVIVPYANLTSTEPTHSAWYQANWDLTLLFDVEETRSYRYFLLDVGVQSGNIQMCVVRFTSAGNTPTFTRIANTGIIACPPAGVTRYDAGSFMLTPNQFGYGLSLWVNNATAQFRHGLSSSIQALRVSQTLVNPNAAGIPASGTAAGFGSRYVHGFGLEANGT